MRIEKNIPLPEKRKSWKAIIVKMKPGDSVEVSNKSEARALIRALGILGLASRQKGLASGKVRVWRE